MRPIYVYIEGIVAQGTKFYVQVFANENGALGTQSFTINGNNPNITYYSFNSGMGVSSLGTSMLGGTDLSTVQNLASPLFFRAYLEIEQGWRAHNLSAQFYSNSLGAQWGISQITFIYIDDPSIDTNLILSPSAVPIMQL